MQWAIKGCILLFVLLVAAYFYSVTQPDEYAHPVSALSQTLNQCDLISSKAASGLAEALPFQRMEKQARQSRVLEQCMQDRGYSENPAWVDFANIESKHIAQEKNVSEDEAFESLRREAMLKAEDRQHPLYWRKQKIVR